MKMQILGKAMPAARYPQNVLIMAHADAPESVASTRDVHPHFGIDFAATTSEALAIWLAEAINHILDGEAQRRPRPDGTLVERGHFSNQGNSVWAWDWRGRADGLEVARCANEEAARQMVSDLSTLLGMA